MLNVNELFMGNELHSQNTWDEISKTWICRSINCPPSYDENTKLNDRTILLKQNQLNDIYELSQPIISQISQNNTCESSCIVDPEGFIVYYCLGPQLGLGMQCNATTGINSFNMADLINGKTVEVEIYVETEPDIIDTLMAPIFDINKQIISILMYGSIKEIPRENKIKFYLGAQLIQERYQNKQRLYVYANSIINGISDCALLMDEQLDIIQVNKNCTDLLGLDEYELLGRHITDIMWEEQMNLNAWNIDNQIVINSRGTAVPCTIINKHEFPTWNNGRQFMLIFKVHQEYLNPYHLAKSPFDKLIGETPIMKKVKLTAKNIAKKPCNVLIRGESGTGKELLAEAIHWESGRKGAFVPINCGAIPRELLQSELFGYEDGTFTGARKGGKKGKFEIADCGTLFLDEIGEMPTDMQVSLLRVLQDKMITRIGGNVQKKVDVRIIAATNTNLEEAIARGAFREDLYFRLSVVNITAPPLRQRQDDIPLIVQYVLENLCQEYQLIQPVIEKEVMEILKSYYWKGNVRELRNVVESALLTCIGDRINHESLPGYLLQTRENIHNMGNIQNYEKRAVIDALNSSNGNISRAAKILGITRNTLYKKIDEFDIARSRG